MRDADRAPKDRAPAPEADGLRAISVSFPDVCDGDAAIVKQTRILYDALYYTLAKTTQRRRSKRLAETKGTEKPNARSGKPR